MGDRKAHFDGHATARNQKSSGMPGHCLDAFSNSSVWSAKQPLALKMWPSAFSTPISLGCECCKRQASCKVEITGEYYTGDCTTIDAPVTPLIHHDFSRQLKRFCCATHSIKRQCLQRLRVKMHTHLCGVHAWEWYALWWVMPSERSAIG